MKLAMAQMRMEKDVQKNIEASVKYIEEAAKGGADLVFFPEVQLTQFFPKFEGRDATALAVTLDGSEVAALKNACRENRIWASPNVYLKKDGNYYDCSLMIDADGEIRGISKMVYIYQAEDFYEQDYYHPSEDGFIVYDTPFGKVGIVICFDRHMPESIRSCAMQGAELVLIPTANHDKEPMELFEWEVRIQAFHSQVYVAMCNRVGPEDHLNFCGESLVAGPYGELVGKADRSEQLFFADVPTGEIRTVRSLKTWLALAKDVGPVY